MPRLLGLLASDSWSWDLLDFLLNSSIFPSITLSSVECSLLPCCSLLPHIYIINIKRNIFSIMKGLYFSCQAVGNCGESEGLKSRVGEVLTNYDCDFAVFYVARKISNLVWIMLISFLLYHHKKIFVCTKTETI